LVSISAYGQAPITIDVSPKIAMVNPYAKKVFHVRFRIEPHPDNLKWKLEYDCGSTSSSEEPIRKEDLSTTERLREFYVTSGQCNFQVCLYRKEKGNAACARQKIVVDSR
jgi:hypothetical protein